MKKSIKNFVSELTENEGKMLGGFGAIRGGRNVELPGQNGRGCTNSESCSTSNATDCSNTGDCTQTSNISGCTNSMCLN